jgi:DNA processing protein
VTSYPTRRACDDCLRRSWLIARLSGAIEIARRERRGLREVLTLPDEALFGLAGAAGGARLAAEHEALEPESLRHAAEEAGLHAVCRHDAAHPARLHDLPDVPGVLYVAGGGGDPVARLDELAGGPCDAGAGTAAVGVAVVGTRRASPDGVEIARALGRDLAAAGVTVVSGMALGIDSAAHEGALDAGGATVAVLAGGADRPYPSSKRTLHRRIREHGCVVSELPPGAKPHRWAFPARNRTIAALAQMTVVVEAAERSGSLITAEIAADLGRDVAAVPGPVLAWRSRGTNALLRDGATLVRDARDVLDAVLGVDGARAALAGGAARVALEPRLESLLSSVADGRDTVAALAGTPDQAQPTLAALAELELRGLLRRLPGGRYVAVPR